MSVSKISPLATPEKYCTCEALCSALKRFYRMSDATEWYKHNRQRVLTRALPDQFGISRFETLNELWEYRTQKKHSK